MSVQPSDIVDACVLRKMVASHAPRVAEWIHTEDELFKLAPSTHWPVTDASILSWMADSDGPYMLWANELTRPVAYGEVNHMPGKTRQLWLGHLIVDPDFRSRGLGDRLLQSLLDVAFNRYAAEEVTLVVFPENKIAISCYLKAGMKTQGSQYRVFPRAQEPCLLLKMGIRRRHYLRRFT